MKLSAQENLIPGDTVAEKFANAEKYGLEGIEFWGNRLTDEKMVEIKKVAASSKVKVSTVCSGQRGCLLGTQKSERDLAMSDIMRFLEITADLGAVGLVMVPIFGPPRINDLSPLTTAVELEKKLLIELGKEIGKKAEEVNMTLLIEPLNRYETHLLKTLNDAVEICKAVDNDHIKIMADFFHMSIEERNIPASIEKAGPYIYHVHLAESTRLFPGKEYGHTDFKSGFSALKKIGYDKYMALECSSPGPLEEELPKTISYLKECMK